MKNVLYKHKIALERLGFDLMESLQRKLQNYKAKLDLDNSLFDEYCSVDNLKVAIDDVELGSLSSKEFALWAFGGAFSSVAAMGVLSSIGGLLSTVAPLVGVPVFLASLFYGNVRDKEKLISALDEVMETLDQDIYDNLLSAYQSLFDYRKKEEMFGKIFPYINNEIIDAFKEKETSYLKAKQMKGSPLENEKITKLQQGLKRLEELEKSLQQVVN